MKKNFITGIITGICSAIFLMSILGAAYFYMDEKISNANDNGVVQENESDVNAKDNRQDAEEDSMEQITMKLNYLKLLVDSYFLEPVDPKGFADGIYKGFISSLEDPYSTYYTAEEYKAVREGTSGVYYGIGAYVNQNIKTGIISIVRPFENGPAHEAGLLLGDIIYKIEDEEVTGHDLTDVVSRMKGAEGTTVKIAIIRENQAEPIEVTVERRKVEVPTIETKMLDNDIGYILITEFDEVTVAQFDKAISDLEAAGMKGLIIDVRDNPGGLLDAVVKMLDRILPPGLLVYTKDKYGRRQEKDATNPDKLTAPLAVLINENSASASEIFAGAIQDYKAGTVIGMTSFGKGIVQQLIPLSDGTAVKLTISKYYTPKGRDINGTGIEPDIEIDLSDEMKRAITVPIEKDEQLQKAIEVIMEEITK